MKTRVLFAWLAGVVLVADHAAAQDTTQSKTSQRRVQISKGEVDLPRVDTVYVTRFDTVYVRKLDTVYFPGRRMVHVPYEVVRTDTIVAPSAAESFVRKPFYAALYTGMTMPSGNVDRLYTNGFHAGMIVGWDATQEPVGVRIKGDVALLSREAGALSALVGSGTPTIVNVGADLKVFPLELPGWRIYGTGGMLVSTFRDMAMVAERGRGMRNTGAHNDFYRPVSDGWTARFGWNAGGGADIQLGQQELFVEARAVAVRSDAAWTWFVPISLGIRFF